MSLLQIEDLSVPRKRWWHFLRKRGEGKGELLGIDYRPCSSRSGRKFTEDAAPVPAQVMISQGAHQVQNYASVTCFSEKGLHKPEFS
jgi:hypothetical protein